MPIDIYDYEPYHRRVIDRLNNSSFLTPKEKLMLLEFDRSLDRNRTSYARRASLLEKYLTLRKRYMQTSLLNPTKEQMEAVCDTLNHADIRERSRQDFKESLKQLATWQNGGNTPLSVAWIRHKQLIDSRRLQEKTAQDILTAKEIKKLLNACCNKRDYAIIKMLVECGLRPAELLRMQVKHLEFTDKEYVMLTIPQNTKTGSRKVPIIGCVPALREYLNEFHPDPGNPDAWLWVQSKRYRDQPLKYAGLETIMQKLKRVANIKKRFHSYLFRYTSYTLKARAGWSEQKIKSFHGLAKDSKMLQVYVKMQSEELIDDVLELAGKRVEHKREHQPAFIICPRCHQENESDRVRCKLCMLTLDLELAAQEAAAREEHQKSIEERIAVMDKKLANLGGLKVDELKDMLREMRERMEAKKKK